MHDQDYDQELPLACDDEYWDLPGPLNFQQPKGKPAEISFFICYAKLFEIQASVTNTIVTILFQGINRSNTLTVDSILPEDQEI
jgi:hypothetical protein